MNIYNREQVGSPVNQKIDHSLSLLKQLQTKLHNDQNNYISFKKPRQDSPSGHTRLRTQPYTFSHRNNQNNYETTQFTITQKSEQNPKNSPLPPNTFSHSQPTMIEHNQNDFNSVKDVIKENRKLKKYVNCLLQMNDYLKNQLVKREGMGMGMVKMGHSFQLELMRMEIQYLKELNRDKELELKKCQRLGYAIDIPKKSKSKSKGHKMGISFQQASVNRSHARSASAYSAVQRGKNQRSIYNQEQNTEPYQQLNSHRIEKIKVPKKDSCKTPAKKNSTLGCKNCKSKTVYHKDQFKKKKNPNPQDKWKKCRLCYF